MRREFDPERLESLADNFVNDMGAAMSCALARVGDRLGLYRKLRDLGPSTSEELAAAMEMSQRMVYEWLVNQATGGYVSYDPTAGRFFLDPEQAALLADENSRRFLMGGFQFATALVKAEETIAQSFVHGEGHHWGAQHPDLSIGVGRFFQPAYAHDLVTKWISAIPAVFNRLQQGCTLADIGCGLGYSTMALAEGFPQSRVYGFDSHAPSIQHCQELARERGLSHVQFMVANAASFPDYQFDIVAYFNCLHDVGKPLQTLLRARDTLAKDGLLLLAEPMAGHTVEENFNPVGRIMSGSAALCCVPHGIADGGHSLGTLATDKAVQQVVHEAGFVGCERVYQTKYSRVFLARRLEA
jgi:SAM-dependent methyltransferase